MSVAMNLWETEVSKTYSEAAEELPEDRLPEEVLPTEESVSEPGSDPPSAEVTSELYTDSVSDSVPGFSVTGSAQATVRSNKVRQSKSERIRLI